MKTKKRYFTIAANWKMNCDINETEIFLQDLAKKIGPDHSSKIVLCVPFTSLLIASNFISKSNFHLGAQNCHWESAGAFTGEISPAMLKSVSTEFVIIGHSERRLNFGESDKTVNLRLKNAVKSGLHVILCVGENFYEQESGITFERISEQLKLGLLDVDSENIKNVTIAYEPVWAIGSGRTPSSSKVEEICRFLREKLSSLYSESIAEKIQILYGGSMNAENARLFLKQSDVNGGLLGGASLDPDMFAQIVKVADSL